MKGDAFLSKFAKADKINPCVTLVLYWGSNWNGPETLKDMLNLKGLPERLKEYVNDYPMHLVKGNSAYQKVPWDAWKMMQVHGKLEDLNVDVAIDEEESGEKEATVNVCKAIDDIKNDAMEFGIERGRREGLEALVNTIKSLCRDFEELYTRVVANECYKDVTREQVRKYI